MGKEKLVLNFDHQEHDDCENCRGLTLGWKRRTHARLEFHVEKLVVGCIRSSAGNEFWRSRALRNRGRFGTKNLHSTHVRGDGTNHQHQHRNGLDGCDRDEFPLTTKPTWEPKTSTEQTHLRLLQKLMDALRQMSIRSRFRQPRSECYPHQGSAKG